MNRYIKIYSPTRKKSPVECDFKNENELPEENTKEFLDFGLHLGVNLKKHPEFISIVWKAITSPVPSGWLIFKDKNEQVYYYNTDLDISTWEHPLDYFFRNLINNKLKEKKKKNKYCIVM